MALFLNPISTTIRRNARRIESQGPQAVVRESADDAARCGALLCSRISDHPSGPFGESDLERVNHHQLPASAGAVIL